MSLWPPWLSSFSHVVSLSDKPSTIRGIPVFSSKLNYQKYILLHILLEITLLLPYFVFLIPPYISMKNLFLCHIGLIRGVLPRRARTRYPQCNPSLKWTTASSGQKLFPHQKKESCTITNLLTISAPCLHIIYIAYCIQTCAFFQCGIF
jgi:hypothetical protein